jgi:hypothetical protein
MTGGHETTLATKATERLYEVRVDRKLVATQVPRKALAEYITKKRVDELEGWAKPPTHEQIAQRAYELHLARGTVDGYDLEDWLEAERQLTERWNTRK